MANPTLSASLDSATYAKGDLMTLTVTYGDADQETLAITVSVTDSSGNTTGPVGVSAVIDPLTLEVTDASGRTWAKVSDTGMVAVFQATA